MKRYVLVLIALWVCLTGTIQAASALRSDTLDIRKTTIHLTMTDFVTKNISAHTRLDIKCKQNNVNEVLLDLEGLTVDSVLWDGAMIGFSHNSNTLAISPSLPMNLDDSVLIDVYYHGIPVTDVLWGGFYFSGQYAFQMGVGFYAQPHSYGRTWHPCLDNFVERSSYEFFIETPGNKMAVCNGLLIDSTTLANTNKQWHWLLNKEIPSYLASVAAAPYVLVKQTLNTLQGTVPSWIACEAADTTAVNGSFSHLQQSMNAFEQAYGNYKWPRVGYALVPFNGGAMEHATNIHIGKGFIDGTLNYEKLIAHELSHHWWGNLVTCKTAGDMWLNEGFASYSEFLHQEYTYGPEAYMNEVKQNHYDMLARCHLDDNGYRSVANMDSLYTYGTTVYRLSADRLHTLRRYMGDNVFFSGLKNVLNLFENKAISSADLNTWLTLISGYNTQPFFTNWIYDKGFPHFSVDSVTTTPNGTTWETAIYMRQRKHQNDQYFNAVPLPVAVYDALMQRSMYTVMFNGRCMQLNLQLPFKPVMVAIDPDNAIGDAITDDMQTVKQIGFTTMPQAKIRVITKSINVDSALVRVQHHWVAPDRFKSSASFPGYRLCNTHYWQVDGIGLDGLNGLLHFTYDAGVNNSYLDSTWINNSEDSIRLFYRKDAREEWQFANDSIRTGVTTDRYGNMYCKEIKAGEYCLGIKKTGFVDTLQTDAPTGGCGLVNEVADVVASPNLFLYPNPAATWTELVGLEQGKARLRLYNAVGQMLVDKIITVEQDRYRFEWGNLMPGVYRMDVRSNNKVRQATLMIRP